VAVSSHAVSAALGEASGVMRAVVLRWGTCRNARS
jgi:hypothetical protein